MEILKVLNDPNAEIYPEDLDFFEVELATGDYDRNYIRECKSRILQIREIVEATDSVGRLVEHSAEVKQADGVTTALPMFLSAEELKSLTEQPVAEEKSEQEKILSEIERMRKTQNYKTSFRKYINRNVEINEAFIDRNFAFFQPTEMKTLISLKSLSEDFLEKYFNVLDKQNIAKYQCFSEGFFMKHYTELDAKLVLTKGKNEWRKKANRSQQLDVFLRLKGIRQ